jgi:hypothetical protein
MDLPLSMHRLWAYCRLNLILAAIEPCRRRRAAMRASYSTRHSPDGTRGADDDFLPLPW